MQPGRTLALFAIAAFFALTLYTTNGCGGSGETTAPPPVGTLTGLVTNASSGAPIAGARVAVTSSRANAVVFTPASGEYVVVVPVDTYNVEVSASGFRTFTGQAFTSTGTTRLNVALTPL